MLALSRSSACSSSRYSVAHRQPPRSRISGTLRDVIHYLLCLFQHQINLLALSLLMMFAIWSEYLGATGVGTLVEEEIPTGARNRPLGAVPCREVVPKLTPEGASQAQNVYHNCSYLFSDYCGPSPKALCIYNSFNPCNHPLRQALLFPMSPFCR